MPTYEHNVLQQHKDQNGDMHIDYPITKPENVVGLYESPALTGVPTAPTAKKGTNTEQIATTEFVQTELSEIKKELSDGMTDVAAAITEKGVETATNATLALAAANIRKIKTGGGEIHGATIAVTTAEETLVGMAVTLSKENVAVQNKTFDENGTCSFTDIQVGGDYTISSGNGEINVSETISITSDNIVNKTILHFELNLFLDGLVAMPLNDIATWLKTNSTGETSSKGYTTLAQVIADTTTLNNLMANKSAMQYLARSTGFADEGCASETFMTYLGKSTYLDSTVLNSDIWVTAVCNSTYFELVLNVKVPTMTSNNAPTGIAFASSNYKSNYAFRAFDGIGGDSNNISYSYRWVAEERTNFVEQFIGYKFVNPMKCKKITIKFFRDGYSLETTTFNVEASNNNIDWTDISTDIIINDPNNQNLYFKVELPLNTKESYLYYRLLFKSPTTYFNGKYTVAIWEMQFYGI